MNKYHSKTVTVDGIRFDSIKEANRYQELRILEKAGEIHGLERQVTFTLIPDCRDPETGKVIERAVKYVADFQYEQDGRRVVEDTKGFRTPEYKIKRKLMRFIYGIEIREV